jgi:hypothetical protein
MKTQGLMTTVLFLAMVPVAAAQPMPGRWQKLDRQVPGLQVIVEMKDGEKINGGFKASDPETVTVLEITGTERLLRKADVRKVVTAEKRSGSLANGAAIGFMSGFLPVFVLGASGGYAAEGAAFGLIFGGIGTAVGVGIDAAVRGHEVMYQAPR